MVRAVTVGKTDDAVQRELVGTAASAGPPAPDGAAVLVVMPTYCERESLPVTLARLRERAPGVDVLVVDDASPDGTGDLAEALHRDDAPVHVLHRARKEGLGPAYVAGFAWGLRRGYDVLVEMDADGSHRPEDLPRLLAALVDGADVVTGSRWTAGGAVRDWPRRRVVLSRAGNRYVRLVMGLPVADATGGYRAFSARALRALDLSSVQSAGYCFQVDLTWRALAAGLRVVEVPITFVERRQGRSKMSGAIVAEALWRTTCWGLRRRRQRAAELVRARLLRSRRSTP